MMTNPYDMATSAYGKAHGQSLSKIEIVLALYRGLLRFLELTREHNARKEYEQSLAYKDKAVAILIALQSHIDHDAGGKYAKHLNDFYSGAYMRLQRAVVKKEAQEELLYIEKNVRDIYNHWKKLHENNPELF